MLSFSGALWQLAGGCSGFTLMAIALCLLAINAVGFLQVALDVLVEFQQLPMGTLTQSRGRQTSCASDRNSGDRDSWVNLRLLRPDRHSPREGA